MFELSNRRFKMQKNKSGLVPVKINLNQKGILTESFLTMLGAGVESILKRMFDLPGPEVSVTGTEPQLRSFANALRDEKSYMESIIGNGLNNPTTFSSRYKLQNAVKNFETETGLKWPIS